MNAVLCFVSDTLDLYFLNRHFSWPSLELGGISLLWKRSPAYTSICLSPPSVCKIMDSHKGASDPLLHTFHPSFLCDRKRQGELERKDEVQTGSNIIETDIEALGPRRPTLVLIMTEVRRKWPHL